MSHFIMGNCEVILLLFLVVVLLVSTLVQQVFTEYLLCVRHCILCHSESPRVGNGPEI